MANKLKPGWNFKTNGMMNNNFWDLVYKNQTKEEPYFALNKNGFVYIGFFVGEQKIGLVLKIDDDTDIFLGHELGFTHAALNNVVQRVHKWTETPKATLSKVKLDIETGGI